MRPMSRQQYCNYRTNVLKLSVEEKLIFALMREAVLDK